MKVYFHDVVAPGGRVCAEKPKGVGWYDKIEPKGQDVKPTNQSKKRGTRKNA